MADDRGSLFKLTKGAARCAFSSLIAGEQWTPPTRWHNCDICIVRRRVEIITRPTWCLSWASAPPLAALIAQRKGPHLTRIMGNKNSAGALETGGRSRPTTSGGSMRGAGRQGGRACAGLGVLRLPCRLRAKVAALATKGGNLDSLGRQGK